MSGERYDTAILGAGCAGLSLARELARSARAGKRIPRTIILDPKTGPKNDRIWSFWKRNSEPVDYPLLGEWAAWNFSAGAQEARRTSAEFSYVSTASGDFLGTALCDVEGVSNLRVNWERAVDNVRPEPGGFRVETRGESLFCHQIIDTRPPERKIVQKSPLYQVFSGIEVMTDHPVVDPTTVGLMEDMSETEGGLEFRYILPFSSSHFLFELTRFTSRFEDPSNLEERLENKLRAFCGGPSFHISRREQGCIPMGLPSGKEVQTNGYFEAGIRGGAARPSSGYAFLPIQRWATVAADALVRGVDLPPADGRGFVSSQMDDILLGLVRRHPQMAPDIFFRLGSLVPPDALVRFLSDEARHMDILSILRSQPPLPFINQAIRHGWKGAA